jgi:hypothetical protein
MLRKNGKLKGLITPTTPTIRLRSQRARGQAL